MAATTFTAKQVAKEVSTKLKRPVDAKRVRAWVRDHVAAYQDDSYTAHIYDTRLRNTIVSGMTKSAAKGRSAAASRGRGTKPAPTAEEPTAE